jgi:LmbE family N-acetylglucosaminyl deacetylase
MEQTMAASKVGVERLIFLRHADGTVQATLGLRRELSRVIRQVRPDRVIAPSPLRNLDSIYASHPDHLATGDAAVAAVYPDARNPFAFTELLDEGLEPYTVPDLWLMSSSEITVAVDITESFDAKINALLSHESQITDPVHTSSMIRQWNRSIAKKAGLKKPRVAEGFRRVNTG